MDLILPTAIENLIRRHAAETYPAECCGIVGGAREVEALHIRECFPVQNNREEAARHNRYVMEPKDVLQAEKLFTRQGMETLGFYHSHPDHPARPSQYDLDHASWPGLAYLIVAVEKGVPLELTSWFLSPDRQSFLPQSIRVQ